MGCHALLQGISPTPAIEPMSLLSPALAGGFFTTSATWEALVLFCDEHKILKEIRVFPPGIKLATYVNKLFP